MRRTTLLLVLVAVVLLLGAPETRGGGGLAEPFLVGKISGPAVSATIVIDPSFQTSTNPGKGRTSIRVQKGTSFAGATFLHPEASLAAGAPGSWVLGCDGTKGAQDPTNPAGWNVTTLTQFRFANKPLTNWIPGDVADNILYGSVQDGGLGLSVDPSHPVAGVTAVDNPVCTSVDDGTGTRYVLSFTAVIQFAESAQ